MVIGSQRFIEARSPRDYLGISSIDGIKWKAKAIYAGENNNFQIAQGALQMSMDALNNQLAKWTGSGTIQTPRFNPQNGATRGPSYVI